MDKSCATCLSGRFDSRELGHYGAKCVGTCVSGGPRPGDGCSDVGASEVCERWRGREDRA